MSAQLQLQLNAQVKAERGMAQSLAHAESDYEGWAAVAMAYLRAYAGHHEAFTAFMVVGASKLDKSFPAPDNSRCWGGIFKRAINEGLIVDSKRTMPHPQRHACPAKIWASRIYRG